MCVKERGREIFIMGVTNLLEALNICVDRPLVSDS